MSTDDVSPSMPSRRRRIALVAALPIALAIAILWGVRKPVAEHVLNRTFAERGVVAHYAIADLGLGRQRLTNVVLGDPAHPDLVADWIETETGIGLDGPVLAGVRIGRARIRARLIDGRVSFGSIDRLLPAPSGKRFVLPAIDARIGDARIRLVTPYGLIGISLSGGGRLDHGFRGRLAAISAGLSGGGCTTGAASAVVAIRTATTGPTLTGPLRLASLACRGIRTERLGADVDAVLRPALDGWRGSARLAAAAVQAPGVVMREIAGSVTFDGDARRTAGTLDLRSQGFAGTDMRGAALALDGRYALADRTIRYDGRVGGQGIVPSAARLAPIARIRGRAAGTPAGPLVDRLSDAIVAAGRRFDLDAGLAATLADGHPTVAVDRLTLRAASGAHADVRGTGIGYDGAHVALDRAQGSFGGGGLPEGTVQLVSAGSRGLRARMAIQPYAAGSAQLALAPVRIAAADGTIRIVTDATISGPIGAGRIDGATLPLDIRSTGGGIVANPGCTPIAFGGLVSSGLTLGPTRATLCPVAGGIVRSGAGGTAFGATIGATALGGAIGRTPLALGIAGGRIDRRGFALTGVAARIGVADRATRIEVARLAGRFADGAVGGDFAGAGGRIGTLPLRLADVAGGWRYAGGRLTLDGTLMVGDTAATARFKPLRADRVAFALAGDAITATATLMEPTHSVKVAEVSIAHALASGAGHAELSVPSLAFRDGFQPEMLTPLTLGVIAEVRGTIDGAAHIAWADDRVTSTGDFHTGGTDLAAAVGPVTGIAGTIHFTDLLSLRSASGQVATVRTINPGIPVNDGTIRYQILPDARIRIERGDWPFAGGTLRLDPTLLDFSQPAERRMTFHVAHMAADQFLQQFDFKNLDATGIFDGVLPMIFDASGGRIEGGSLTVREGGGTLAYVGEIGQKDLGTWANIAFQALKSLRYRSLEIVMNGPLAGEMVTEVKFAGISQGQGAKSNFLIRRLQRLPFVFNIRIKAPFRGLIDSAQSFYDPKRLVQRNLPALLDEQAKRAAPPIQPPASRTVP